MPDAPLVTVIIATYNKREALRYAIDSVLWQTMGDFELLVIGDACSDGSEQLVESYQDARVHWYNLPTNSGYQSEPNNEGLRRARGTYIAYLNHDDIWLPRHLETLVREIREKNADLAFSILEWVMSWKDNYPDIPDYPQAPTVPPEASATLHTRQLVQDIGYWRKPGETTAVPRSDYFRRAQHAGKRFVFVPMLTVLKFGASAGGYASVSQQPEYMQRVSADPCFAERELAAMLVSTWSDLQRLPTIGRLRSQVRHRIREWLVKRRIEPTAVQFWVKPGQRISTWRRQHGLE